MPEPTTTAGLAALGGTTPLSAGLAVGLALVGHAVADELGDDVQPEAVTVVPTPGADQVGIVMDPSSITGPGGLVVVAWVLSKALKGWQPKLGISVSMDDRTHQVVTRVIDRLVDRGGQG